MANVDSNALAQLLYVHNMFNNYQVKISVIRYSTPKLVYSLRSTIPEIRNAAIFYEIL